MKFLSKKREQGGVLVVVLITCGVIATVLASYLILLSTRYTLTARSTAWNAAMPVLEAGVEEAMTHLQYDTNQPSANGWDNGTYAGQSVVTKTRNFADGSYALVNIADAGSNNPTIYSSGFVPAPLGQGYILRTVRVTTTRPKTFGAAISANGLVKLSGSNTIVDSYNSCVGPYSATNSLGTNGSIATNSRTNSAINLTGGHVYGTVTTGPGGTVAYSGGSAGDNDWNATHTGVEAGWGADNMNVAFPNNSPPSGGPFVQPPVVTAGGSNIWMVGNDTYQMPNLNINSSSKPMFVTGNATLYVVGNVTVSAGYIRIFPGASLTLIVGGAITSISGSGVINETGQAANFTYIGLPANTQLTYNGSSAFVGTINAPQAALTISGTAGAYGAAIVKSANISGGGFHYDECLGQAGGFLTITSWREL